MLIGDKIGAAVIALCLLGLGAAMTALAVSDHRRGKDRAEYMGRCIEKWSEDMCAMWDKYGRRDLAFRKD